MLKVVSNTTPIISLLKISRLDILRDLYGEVFIPFAVFQEMETERNKEYYKDLSKVSWINIVEIRDLNAPKYFLDLDAGESEAIVLATEIGADLLLIDEKLGRYHAKHAGFKVTGTIGVLLKAKNQGLVNALKPLLIELTSKGIWLADNLIEEILNQVDEQ